MLFKCPLQSKVRKFDVLTPTVPDVEARTTLHLCLPREKKVARYSPIKQSYDEGITPK
jgi:hypothetical protein